MLPEHDHGTAKVPALREAPVVSVGDAKGEVLTKLPVLKGESEVLEVKDGVVEGAVAVVDETVIPRPCSHGWTSTRMANSKEKKSTSESVPW